MGAHRWSTMLYGVPRGGEFLLGQPVDTGQGVSSTPTYSHTISAATPAARNRSASEYGSGSLRSASSSAEVFRHDIRLPRYHRRARISHYSTVVAGVDGHTVLSAEVSVRRVLRGWWFRSGPWRDRCGPQRCVATTSTAQRWPNWTAGVLASSRSLNGNFFAGSTQRRVTAPPHRSANASAHGATQRDPHLS